MNWKSLKKYLATGISLVMLSAALAGCGGGGGGQQDTAAAEQAVTEAQAAAETTAGEVTGEAAGEVSTEAAAEKTAAASLPEKTIVLAESWSFPFLYPVLSPETASNFGAAYWSKSFYDTLVTYDKEGKIVGSLAKEWEVSDDGLTYTFKLNDGIMFSDGTPVNAEAVKQSIDAANVNLGGYLGNYGKIGLLIANTEAKDEQTFVITLSSPYYAALNDLTYCVPYAIVNPKAFEGGVEKAFENCTQQTMGSGPYMFESYTDGIYTFVQNPYYWGEKPDVEAFQVKEIPENESKIMALQSKEVDALIGSAKLTYEGYGELQSAGYGTSVNDKGNKTCYLGMRIADTNIYNEDYTEVIQTVPAGVFADKNVRQAAAHLIDQQLISQQVFNNIDSPAETLFSADKPFCDVEQTTYETDPDEAARLLKESGWEDTDGDGILDKDGEKLSVTISFTNDFGTLAAAMAAIEGQLEKGGFEVTLAPAADMMDWFMAAMTGSYDLIYWQTNGGAMDPSSTVSNIGSMADPVLGQLPGFGGITPEMMTELDTTASEERVQEIYADILKGISDDCLVIPIAYMNDFCAWNPDKIEGYEYDYDSTYTLVQNIKLK